MKITDEKRDQFIRMIRAYCLHHGYRVEFEYSELKPEILNMIFKSTDKYTLGTQRLSVNFENECSLSEAAAPIMASLLLYKDDKRYAANPPRIKDVIFNEPATIVFWYDGTKTVVKCQEHDEYDPEKGLAMAISKKVLGNKGNYNNEFDKWLKTYRPKQTPKSIDINFDGSSLAVAVSRVVEAAKKFAECGISAYSSNQN